MRKLVSICVCVLSVGIFLVRGECAVRSTSQTFDEAVHLAAGYSYWRTGDFRMNSETPPVLKLIWALPITIGDRPPFAPNPEAWEENDGFRMGAEFLYDTPIPLERMLHPARRTNVIVGTLLVVLVGWWAHRLWGFGAGLAGWALAALDPNLLGQSAVLSTDVGLTLFCTLAAYCLWEYSITSRRGWFILGGVAMGLALATKFSALAFVAGLGIGTGTLVLAGGSFAVPGTSEAESRWFRLKHTISAFVRLGLIAALTVLPTYFVVQALDWPRGIRQQIGRSVLTGPKFFFLNEISRTGWWLYFPMAICLKTPAGTLVLAMLGLARKFDRQTVAFVLIPSAAFLLVMMATRLNIGIRVVLPAYVLLWLLAARAGSLGSKPFPWIATSAVIAGIVLPPVIDRDFSGQRSLSYFNGVVAGRQDGHNYLGDSNLDWGQGLNALAAAVRERGEPVIYLSYAGTAQPESFGIRYERLPSYGQFRPAPRERVDRQGPVLVAVSVTNLQGIYLPDPTLFHWLRERKPVSKTDDSIWLFDVTGDDAAISKLRTMVNP